MFGMGWVIKRPSQGAAAEMLPKTHDVTYSSWTPRGSLQDIEDSFSAKKAGAVFVNLTAAYGTAPHLQAAAIAAW